MSEKPLEEIEVTLTTPRQQVSFRVSKVSTVKIQKGMPFCYFDKLPDGTWRLCFTEGVLKTKEES